MQARWHLFAAAVLALASGGIADGQWVAFEETPERLVAPSAVGAADVEEKDYATGDVDNDGDLDLVVARKQPFTTTGKRTNVLLLNEDGVLTDRTADHAASSDAADDQGFLTPTNDRDVILVDVNGDGWLDVVTATTLSDNDPTHISHPRVYVNLGETGGVWQGFRHETARIPQMHPVAGPRFCAVSAGDVTGNGAPDLYFSDYDSGGNQVFDFNDRLLINDGNGFFSDQTTQRLDPVMYTSNFGIFNRIADMNDDGVADIVRLTALGTPYHIGISYNDPLDAGFFGLYEQVYQLSAYEAGLGDLNGDGNLDIVAVDDGTDRYLLHQDVDSLGRVDFDQFSFGPQTNVINAGNVIIEDLDEDGWNDVIIADVDVDIPGCGGRTFVFHNLGNAPDVSFQEQGDVIPFDHLTGVHDVAVIDLDEDGWQDLVLGRCTGTEIWMNQPPVGLSFSYPNGLPGSLVPDATTTVLVKVTGIGASEPAVETGVLSFRVDGAGPYTQVPMTAIGPSVYMVDLPALACTQTLDYFFAAESTSAETFTDPPGAPATAFAVIATLGTEILLRDEIEDDVDGWTVENDPSLTSGSWQQAEPIGTLTGGGEVAAPDQDATQGVDNVRAFVTENGAPGGAAGDADVDGGPTRLLTPVLDLDGTDATISYARWFFSVFGDPDVLTVDVTADGGDTWMPVMTHTTSGTGGAWETVSFTVSDHVEPTANVRVRFTTSDPDNLSVTEAGIDNFQVDVLLCPDLACPADTSGDGVVNVDDLVEVVVQWGPCETSCAADVTDDGVVDVNDLVAVVTAWGPCS